MRVFVYVIFFCYRLPLAQAFTCGAVTARDTRSSCPYVIGSSARLVRHSALKVPASELESNLSDAERTTVRVVRQAGPSVAFVTSVWPRSNSTRAESSAPGTGAPTTNLPLGQSLGSGSAFVVDAAGYLATNYHVIERAYQLQTAERTFQSVSDQVLGNISAATGLDVSNFFRCVLESSLPIRPAPSVFVRLNSATRYQECRIVDVQPDLDLAVLQIVPDVDSSEVFQPVSFGISSDLLVGQGLIAIGNPFGLDKTVTTGVVSALNREIRTSGNNGILAPPIRNCVQTDCSINPGNSGGPLLNFQGEVIGINTAIVTTSGTFSGIGFAVPSDAVQPVVQSMLRRDKPKQKTKKMPWLGVEILKVPAAVNGSQTSKLTSMAWIGRIARSSPASSAGLRACFLDRSTGGFKYGDAIVAINGRPVADFVDVQTYLEQSSVGEKLTVTLEDGKGDRRVAYLTLTVRP